MYKKRLAMEQSNGFNDGKQLQNMNFTQFFVK